MKADDDASILLVEDDPNDVLLIRRAISKARIANPLHVAQDGQAAIDYLEGRGPYGDRVEHPLPVLTLLDLHLPRKSGHEVLRWIRGQPGLKRLPVVVLTGSSNNEDINRAYDAGANSYLVKPVTFDDLIDLLRHVDAYWMLVNEAPELEEKRGAGGG